jgi:hypothetical protein
MNITWTNMTGFGAMACNHGGEPVFIPSTHHHYQAQKPGNARADGQRRSSPAPERDDVLASQYESGSAETKSISCKTA